MRLGGSTRERKNEQRRIVQLLEERTKLNSAIELLGWFSMIKKLLLQEP